MDFSKQGGPIWTPGICRDCEWILWLLTWDSIGAIGRNTHIAMVTRGGTITITTLRSDRLCMIMNFHSSYWTAPLRTNTTSAITISITMTHTVTDTTTVAPTTTQKMQGTPSYFF